MRLAPWAPLAVLVVAPSLALASEPPAAGGVAFGGPGETRDRPAAKDDALRPRDAREAAPLLGTTVSAFGAKGWSAGASGWAGFVGQSKPLPGTQAYEPGGGARIWASPIDRLTVLVEMDRRFYREEFSPAVSAMVRIAGDRRRGWALGAGLTYRAESFAELGGELEGALHGSFARAGFHSDVNVVVGGGLEEEEGGEADAEVKLRLGYDVTPWMRVGADGRFRHRISGDKTLPGGRLSDVMGGPELLFGYKSFFWALAAGPTTVGVVRDYAWTGTGTFGVAIY
jgi:hypothetical protein